MRRSAIAFYQFLQLLRQYVLVSGEQRVGQLLGRCCIGCNQISQYSICDACCLTLKHPEFSCRVCGIKLSAATSSLRCASCLALPPSYHRLDAIASYEGLPAELVVAAKIARSPSAIEAMRYLQQRVINKFDTTIYMDYTVLAMPIPKWRLLQRGFNLPTILADDLARQSHLPRLPCCAVTLPWQTKKQALMTWQQRQKRHFDYRVNTALPKKILIVDDVVTTGKTVEALANKLRQHGVKTVAVWTFARTQKK